MVRGKVFKARKIRWNKECVWWQTQPGRMAEGFRRRGSFDVTASLAKDINLKAFERVTFVYRSKRWIRSQRKRRLAYSLSSEKTNYLYTKNIAKYLRFLRTFKKDWTSLTNGYPN